MEREIHMIKYLCVGLGGAGSAAAAVPAGAAAQQDDDVTLFWGFSNHVFRGAGSHHGPYLKALGYVVGMI